MELFIASRIFSHSLHYIYLGFDDGNPKKEKFEEGRSQHGYTPNWIQNAHGLSYLIASRAFSHLEEWILSLCTKYTSVLMMLLLTLNPGRSMIPTTADVVPDESAAAAAAAAWVSFSSSSEFQGTTEVMNEESKAWPGHARKILAGLLKENANLCNSHTETASLQKLL
jgi:hypothetical protein